MILSLSDTRYKPNRFILKDLKRFVRFLSRSDTRYQIAYGERSALATWTVFRASPYGPFRGLRGEALTFYVGFNLFEEVWL